MMLNRRGGRENTPPHHHRQSVSRAQFQSALQSYHQSPRIPASRLVKPSLSWDSAYSRYENTSPRKTRHSDDVMLPPVHKTAAVRPLSSTRRPVKRGPRKLPNVKNSGNTRKIAWYHKDGTVNLQALANLVNQQSFPRTQSYYDHLEKIKNGTWPPPANPPSPRHDDWRLIPLRFVDDDELTPRKRAERDSLLHLLLTADDLTEEELEQIAMYVIPDQRDVELTPRSCLKKSPRPKSSSRKKKKIKHQSPPQESPRSKSVHFLRTSPVPHAEMSGSPRSQSSPRPQSCPSPITRSPNSPRPRRFSDPFHVASPLTSPRVLGSPDEVAYFLDIESPPEVPASPELIPEPKITYYDESGEEIEEEIQTKDRAAGEGTMEDASPLRENPTPCPDESPPSESSKRPVTPMSDSDPPEYLPELDTPRVNRDTVNTSTSPRSEQNSNDFRSPRPQGHSLSDTSDSPRRPSSSRAKSPSEDDPADRQRAKTPEKEEDSSSVPPAEAAPDTPGKEESSSQLSATSRPGSAPAEQSRVESTRTKHSRQKSKPAKESGLEPASAKQTQLESTRDKRSQASTPAEQTRPESTPTKKSGLESTTAKPSRPESAPATESQSPHASRKSRPKSSKHHRSSRSGSRSTEPAQQSPGEEYPGKKNSSGRGQFQEKRTEAPTTRPPPKRSEPAREEPQPIPVISLTRGQLGSIPPHSPRIQTPADVPVIKLQPKEVTDSVRAQHSPRSSTLQGAESLSGSFEAGNRGRGRDNRMKIWLTRTAWNRHVECVD